MIEEKGWFGVPALNACFVLAQPLQAAQDWLGMPEPKKRAEGPDR